VRLVFDRLLRLPVAGYLARTARDLPVWVVCDADAPAEGRRALERAGVETIPAVDLADGLRQLRARDVRSVFCEGGAAVADALLRANLVDRLYLFYAPLFLGAGGRSPFGALPDVRISEVLRWRHLATRSFGPDTLITLAR